VIMEYEQIFFLLWAQELLEVTSKLPVKLDNPVIDVRT
jgi:hypothetical protein